jgi:hypothetical protein
MRVSCEWWRLRHNVPGIWLSIYVHKTEPITLYRRGPMPDDWHRDWKHWVVHWGDTFTVETDSLRELLVTYVTNRLLYDL